VYLAQQKRKGWDKEPLTAFIFLTGDILWGKHSLHVLKIKSYVGEKEVGRGANWLSWNRWRSVCAEALELAVAHFD
jgi:hypothetical protein